MYIYNSYCDILVCDIFFKCLFVCYFVVHYILRLLIEDIYMYTIFVLSNWDNLLLKTIDHDQMATEEGI